MLQADKTPSECPSPPNSADENVAINTMESGNSHISEVCSKECFRQSGFVSGLKHTIALQGCAVEPQRTSQATEGSPSGSQGRRCQCAATYETFEVYTELREDADCKTMFAAADPAFQGSTGLVVDQDLSVQELSQATAKFPVDSSVYLGMDNGDSTMKHACPSQDSSVSVLEPRQPIQPDSLVALEQDLLQVEHISVQPASLHMCETLPAIGYKMNALSGELELKLPLWLVPWT